MRVALFTETYLPYLNGIVTHVKILKEGLEKLGHEVLIVTAEKGAIKHHLKDGVLYCPAVEMKRFYGYGVSLPVSPRRIAMVKKFNPDIIHIHNEFGIGISGIITSKVLRVPLVYTLHSMYDDYVYYVAPKPLHNTVKKFALHYTKFLANRATALTGPSVKCEEYFKLAGVKKPVAVIANSVELDDFSREHIPAEKAEQVRRQFGIPDDAFVACFVGRLGKEKSVDIMLSYFAEQIAQLDRIHIIIIGTGPQHEELMEQAKALGLEDRVHFAGKIPHEEVPPYYRASDVYLTASLSEMNSISMLEGMACGLPVLQRLDPSNAYQLQEGINGYFFETAVEMADVLVKLRDLPQEKMEAFRNSVTETVKRSGAEDLANHMCDVYGNALAEYQERKAVGGFF